MVVEGEEAEGESQAVVGVVEEVVEEVEAVVGVAVEVVAVAVAVEQEARNKVAQVAPSPFPEKLSR